MILATRLRLQITAFAVLMLLAQGTGLLAELVDVRYQDLETRHTSGEVSKGVAHSPSWTSSLPSPQRILTITPAFGVVPVDVSLVPSLRAFCLSQLLTGSRDSRHRIQRVERLLLLI